MIKLLILNGPNLHALGEREIGLYGSKSFDTVLADLNACVAVHHGQLNHRQSNHEGVLIDAIYEARREKVDYVIFNGGALTHTSIALRDAFLATALPFIEVHISNIYARENYRTKSFFSDIALGSIVGFGLNVYQLALDALISIHNLK